MWFSSDIPCHHALPMGSAIFSIINSLLHARESLSELEQAKRKSPQHQALWSPVLAGRRPSLTGYCKNSGHWQLSERCQIIHKVIYLLLSGAVRFFMRS